MTLFDVGMIRIEAADLARRKARNRAALAWLVLHVAVLCQVAGAGVTVAGIAVMIGAIAGVVYGATTAMILGGILTFAWGALREGGRL